MFVQIATAILIPYGWELLGTVARFLPGPLSLLFGAVLALVIVRRQVIRRSLRERAEVRAARRPRVDRSVAFAFLVVTLVNVSIWLLLEATLGAPRGGLVESPIPTAGKLPPVTFAEMVIIAPVVEELAFRGRLLRFCQRRYGKLVSVLLSAAVFAAAHLQLLGLAPRFLTGTVYGMVALKTSSVWSCMLLHGSANAVLFALREWDGRQSLLRGWSPSAIGLAGGVGLALGLVGIVRALLDARPPAKRAKPNCRQT